MSPKWTNMGKFEARKFFCLKGPPIFSAVND